MIARNLIALLITFLVALAWLRLNDFAARQGWISSRLSRKIIHIGTGPLFILCWPLFTNTPYSRYIAALVPLFITLQFVLVGAGLIQDEAAIQAMSRTGDRRELLRGPLYYGIAFVLLTTLFWYDTPTGIVALMLLCGGDGLADILGRQYGSAKLPWNKGKSWAGSFGMFLGGWIFAAGIVADYTALGLLPSPWVVYLIPIMLIVLAGTVIESLPLQNVDNISITLGAVVIGIFFW